MKFRMSFLQVVLLVINVVFMLLLLSSYLAAHTNPSPWWPAHLLGLAYPLLLAANVLFLILWLFQGHIMLFAPLLAILIGWPQLTNFFAFNLLAKNEEKGIRVMTYNVRNFDLYKWNYNEQSRAQIIELIKKANPDILCLQEYFSSDSGLHTNLEVFTKELNMPYYHIEQTLTLRNKDHWGIATFSKYPIGTKKGVKFPNSQHNAFIYSDIDIDGQKVRVFNLHLQSVRLGPEDFMYLEKFAKNQEADVTGAKTMAGKLRSGFVLRAPQADMVRAEIKASDYPVVVCGDFNTTPTSYEYHTISKKLQDAYLKKGFGIGNTYAGIIPALRIDYVLMDKGLKVNSYEREKAQISDHFPVMVTFDFAGIAP